MANGIYEPSPAYSNGDLVKINGELYKVLTNNKNKMNWFLDSNRYKHFLFAIPIGLVLTILCALGVAAGMEFKDKQWGGQWDWVDFGCTVLGGLVGQAIQILLIWWIM